MKGPKAQPFREKAMAELRPFKGLLFLYFRDYQMAKLALLN